MEAVHFGPGVVLAGDPQPKQLQMAASPSLGNVPLVRVYARLLVSRAASAPICKIWPLPVLKTGQCGLQGGKN